MNDAQTPPPPEITLLSEIEPGKRYLLSTDCHLTPEQADKVMGVLGERFPESTFAVAYGIHVAPEPPEAVDLVAALKRARTKVNREWQAAPEASRIALSGAAYALDYLAKELATQERDGAGVLPAPPAEPVSEPVQPAPSRLCPESPDGLHNRVQMLDGDNQPMSSVHCGFCGVPR